MTRTATDAASPTPLDERYGRTRDRRLRDRVLLIGGAIAFAVVLVAWVVWAGLDGQRPTVEVADTGHIVRNDERAVDVSWRLTVQPGTETACIVKALNEDFTVVGWKVVEIPAGDAFTRSFTERVAVAHEANTGLIDRCWLT